MANRNEEVLKLSENKELVGYLQSLISESLSMRLRRLTEWNKLDRAIKGYKDRSKSPDAKDSRYLDRPYTGPNGRLDETQAGQDYIDDVNIPLLFFMLDTLTAQLSKIFFSKDVIWSYDGRTGDDLDGAKKLTEAVRTAGQLFQNTVELKYTLRNAIKYSQGYIMKAWKECREKSYGVFNGEKTVKTKLVMAGVDLTSISPYRMIVDPAVPPDRLDRMRFCGHWRLESKHDIYAKYGVEINNLADKDWLFVPTQKTDSFLQLFGLTDLENGITTVADLYVDLIPARFGLSDSKVPEVWHFVLCGYDKVLKAKKAQLPAGKFPYMSLVLDGDGYDLDPISRLDLVKDMQALYNWLHNSRMYAIRKELDGDYIVDPLKVDMRDLEQARRKGRPSNVIRLAQGAWGMPNATKDAVYRLQSSNDTKNYAGDSQLLMDNMKIISGAVDPLSGIADSPASRRTAEEIASVKQSAGERIMFLGGIMHDSFMLPLGYRVAKYTQEFLESSVLLRLTTKRDEPLTEVPWQEMMVDFDTVVGSGYLSMDPTEKVGSWQMLLNIVMSKPELMMMFNLVDVIKDLGESAGIKNMDKYISQAGISAVKAMAMDNVRAQTAAGQ